MAVDVFAILVSGDPTSQINTLLSRFVALVMKPIICMLESIVTISWSGGRVCSSHVVELLPTETLLDGRFLVSCSRRYAVAGDIKDDRNAKCCFSKLWLCRVSILH
jgi:hypothetical protein